MYYKELLGHYNYNINMHTFCPIEITAGLNNYLLIFEVNSFKYLFNN